MFCYKCGERLEDNATFCGVCGSNQNQAEQQTQFGQNQQQFYGTPKKKGKTLDWAWITIIVEAALVFVLLVVFFAVNIKESSPEAVAEDYINAIVLGDADKVYDTLYVSDNELLSKENFVKEYGDKINTLEGINIYNQGVIKAEDVVAEGDRATVRLSSNGYPIDSLNLVKEEKNRFLFFPSWKVVPNILTVANVKVKVPYGAKIYIDDKEVNEEYLSSSKTEYTIPELFKGKHKIVLEFDDLQTIPTEFSTSSNNKSVDIDIVQFSEDSEKKIIETAYSYLTKIVNAHLAGQSFDSISSLYSKEAISNEEKSYDYASKHYYAKTSQSGSGITDVSLNNVKGSFTNATFSNGIITATVNLKYRDTNNVVVNTSGLFMPSETKTGVDKDNDETQSMVLVFEDGKWLVKSMGHNAIDGNNSITGGIF